GKAKLEVEKFVLKQGGDVVRPGLIYSDTPGGMVGTIYHVVALSPVIPMIEHSHKPLYLVHIEDLANLILYLAAQPPSGSRLWVAVSSQKWTLAQIVKQIAKNRGK